MSEWKFRALQGMFSQPGAAAVSQNACNTAGSQVGCFGGGGSLMRWGSVAGTGKTSGEGWGQGEQHSAGCIWGH